MIGGARPGEPAEDEALAHLKEAADLEPALAAAHTTLGTLYLKRNDVNAAIRELERATQLDPEATTAYYQLSIAYRKAGERQKAQKCLDRVRLLNEEERKLGTNRFLYQKLKRAPAGVFFSNSKPK